MARTMLPLRALHYIKVNYPLETYLVVWHYFFHLFWGPEKKNISEASELAKALSAVPRVFRGSVAEQQASSQQLFTKQDVEAIMKATNEERWKTELKGAVEEALQRGAFGAPWIWATNARGESEPFFGSDR